MASVLLNRQTTCGNAITIELTFNGCLEYWFDAKEFQDLFHIVLEVLLIEYKYILSHHRSVEPSKVETRTYPVLNGPQFTNIVGSQPPSI